LVQEESKVCFAQSIPVVRDPKKFKRDPSRLFISFRPVENIKNEVNLIAIVRKKLNKKILNNENFFSNKDNIVKLINEK